MIGLLRRRSLRLRVVTVGLAAFLVMLGTSFACQVDCAITSAAHDDATVSAQEHAVAAASAHDLSGDDFAGHLQHAGPCHWAATPLLPLEHKFEVAAVGTAGWLPGGTPTLISVIWPPPRQRPKRGSV